jgi:peptide/nickel transport system substrate-binding protein
MKKLGLLIAGALLLSLALAACTPAAPTEAPAEQPAATEEPMVEATEEPMAEATEEPMMEEMPYPFGDVRVRQALAYLIDRDEIIDRAVQGQVDPLYSFVPPGFLGANEAFLDQYGTGANVPAAEELLTAAGYSADNPLTFDLYYPPEHYGTYAAQMFQVIKEQLEATPMVKVTLQTQEWSTYVGAAINGEYMVSYLGWFFDFPDTSNYLEPFALCGATVGTFYCSDEMDGYLSTGRQSDDQAVREQAYIDAQNLFASDVASIPLTYEEEYVVLNPATTTGVVIGPTFNFQYELTSFVEPKADLIYGTTDQISSLDYQDAYAVHDWELMRNVNVGLMAFAPGTADLIPGTAADFPEVSDDGTVYTFTLADGWAYPDGTPLVAGDYVRGVNRALALADESDVAGTLVTPYVASVDAPDDQTVVFTLTEPVGFFSLLVASAPYFPIPADSVYPDDALNKFPDTVAGVGPWQITSYVENEQTVLERNPNYKLGFPEGAPERVIVRYFEDPTTMGLAVENGEIDVAFRILGPIEAARLAGEGTVTVLPSGGGAIRYLLINNIGPEAAAAGG